VLKEMPKYGDLLICGISTQLHQYLPEFDEIVSQEDPDFIKSGLVKASLIRLSFLAVIQQTEVIESIGFISKERHQKLLSNLATYLIESSPSDLPERS
jgi:mRNA interferase MazF